VSKYVFISAQAATWTVSDLCRGLGVSPSGYYQWRATTPPPAPIWQPAAQQAFSRHASRYGTRRLRAELRAEGYQVGRYGLRSWLRAKGLRALSTRSQRPRTT
jgi:putative transposase